jgi:hypothetical protein
MEKELLHLKPFLVFDDDDAEEDLCACGGSRRNDESGKRQGSNQRLDPQPEGGHNAWFSSTHVHSRKLREAIHRASLEVESQLSPDNVLRGPLLMGIGCSIPCISFVVRRITIFDALQGITVLFLVGVGAYWFLLDVRVRARSLRDRFVATAQDRMQTVVLDDAMQQLFSPNYEGINLIRIVGMATAGSVLYMIPMVTLEHRLVLVQGALGLTREQAEALLCRPGGLQLLWNEYNPISESRSNHTSDDVRPDQNRLPAPSKTTSKAAVDPSTERTLEPSPQSPLVADDQAPRLVASDETSSERSVDGSPEPLQFEFRVVPSPVHRSRAVDTRPTRVNVDEVRLTRADEQAPPGRSRSRVSSPLTVQSAKPPESSTPWTVLRSIVVKHLTEGYVVPNLPRPPSEALLEQCLTVSVGVLCIQLMCSRRARQLVSGAMQATVIATSSALATLSLSLIMLLYGVDPSDENSSVTNGMLPASTSTSKPSTNVEATFNHVSHAMSRRLTRWARHFVSQMTSGDASWDSLRPPSSSSPVKSSLSGVRSAAISRLLEFVQKGWLRLEDHVARPLIHHAVQRRHSLSAFALILILARWKEDRRRRLLQAAASGTAAAGSWDRRTSVGGRRPTSLDP